MRTLLVDNQKDLAAAMRNCLVVNGFAVDVTRTLDEASAAFDCATYDVLVLDSILPDGDGMSWLKRLRHEGHITPAVVVSTLNEVDRRIEALNGGADDFLPKPVHLGELIARIRAVLRRTNQLVSPQIEVGNLSFDPIGRQAKIRGVSALIARRDLCLLEALLRRFGRVVARTSLEESLYSFENEVSPNAIEVGVYRLRSHLSRARATVRIRTVRGIGYVLEEISMSPPNI
jgi:two-component system OmpR family response regulator